MLNLARKHRFSFRLSAVVTFVACAALASAIHGRDQFPQYRTLSGLSGGGFGLDFDGWGSLSGPTALSTPVGYVLGHDQFRVSGAETLFQIDNIKNTTTTGKASFMYGHTFGRFNVAATYFVKSTKWDTSWNLQVQYIPRTEKDPSISFGAEDVRGKGGSAGEGVPGDGDLSRSLFAAVTEPIPIGSRTLYVTGGLGTRRFQSGFASMSCQLASPLRVWAEYDGFGINEGILVGSGPVFHYTSHRDFEANLLVGFTKSRYFTAAITIGF